MKKLDYNVVRYPREVIEFANHSMFEIVSVVKDGNDYVIFFYSE
jgi:hypothetical protein